MRDEFVGDPIAAPRRILVVKLSSLGDVVTATASLRALRRAFPAADLRVAVEGRFRAVVEACPEADGVVEAASRSRLTPGHLRDIGRAIGVERRVRGDFDLALDLQGTRRSAAWVYLSRAAIKAGRGALRPGWRTAFVPDLSQHAVRVCAALCAGIGVPAGDLEPRLSTRPEHEAALDAILDCALLPRAGFVVLNPFGPWASKSWAEDRAVELARRVAGATGVAVVLGGGEGERGPADRVARASAPGDAVSLAGRLSLPEAFCLWRRARLVVSCDSGPMHAAAALGTPVVALFGPTHPERTGPRGPGHVVVQASRPADHHAFRRDPQRVHMGALDVDRVADAVLAALGAAAANAAVAPPAGPR